MSARAAIGVTGTELLGGRVSDRNGPWLAERLSELGFDLAHITIVGDRGEDMLAALEWCAASGIDLVVTSGGLGPTADDITDKHATGTTRAGIERLIAHGRRLMPELLQHEVTAMYAGLRAATEHADYQLQIDPDSRYACAGGIRSTGLTSAMAIAEWLRDALGDAGLPLREARAGLPEIRIANLGERSPRPYQDAGLIAGDPAYGEVVCFCERVTRGEIRGALAGPLAPRDLDGLRRRTRVLMGRCQGFYCGARVRAELGRAT